MTAISGEIGHSHQGYGKVNDAVSRVAASLLPRMRRLARTGSEFYRPDGGLGAG